MFKNLSLAMNSENIGVEELAKILGVHRNTIANKIDGTTEFTLSEIEIIKSIFNKYTFDYLFAREHQPISA